MDNNNWEKDFDKLEIFSAETKTKGEWTFTVDISYVKEFIKTTLAEAIEKRDDEIIGVQEE